MPNLNLILILNHSIRLVEHMLFYLVMVYAFDRTWPSKSYMSRIWLRRFSKTSIRLHRRQSESHHRLVVLKPFGIRRCLFQLLAKLVIGCSPRSKGIEIATASGPGLDQRKGPA